MASKYYRLYSGANTANQSPLNYISFMLFTLCSGVFPPFLQYTNHTVFDQLFYGILFPFSLAGEFETLFEPTLLGEAFVLYKFKLRLLHWRSRAIDNRGARTCGWYIDCSTHLNGVHLSQRKSHVAAIATLSYSQDQYFQLTP